MWVLHRVFACIFFLSAAVQLNDPDPWRWVAIYLAAAAIGVGGWRRPWFAGGIGIVAGGWAVAIGAGGLEPLDLPAVLGGAAMETQSVEHWRELLGLSLIAVYALAAAAMQRASAEAAPSSDPAPQPR